jgi:hypothetical protein
MVKHFGDLRRGSRQHKRTKPAPKERRTPGHRKVSPITLAKRVTFLDPKPEQRVLICTRVKDREPPVQSSIDECEKCGCTVWVANSSPRYDEAWCMACAALFMEPEAKIEKPTKKQLREIEGFVKGE